MCTTPCAVAVKVHRDLVRPPPPPPETRRHGWPPHLSVLGVKPRSNTFSSLGILPLRARLAISPSPCRSVAAPASPSPITPSRGVVALAALGSQRPNAVGVLAEAFSRFLVVSYVAVVKCYLFGRRSFFAIGVGRWGAERSVRV